MEVVRVSKAILEMEIEMPEKCFDCKMNFYAKCFPLNRKISDYKRRNDCPLKPVDETKLYKYKAEAEKIPQMCAYWNNPEHGVCYEWMEEVLGKNTACPTICPKYKETKQIGNEHCVRDCEKQGPCETCTEWKGEM
jgi:hypothetical protein